MRRTGLAQCLAFAGVLLAVVACSDSFRGNCTPCTVALDCKIAERCETPLGLTSCQVTGNVADGTPCGAYVCRAGTCEFCNDKADGTRCDTGRICAGYHCVSVCLNQPDGTVCEGGACVAGVCEFCADKPDGTPCSTGPGSWQQGLCAHRQCFTGKQVAGEPRVSEGKAGYFEFGDVVVGTTRRARITVVNGDFAARTSLSVSAPRAPFAFEGGAYPGTTGTCTHTLAQSARCDLAFTFTPNAATSYSTHDASTIGSTLVVEYEPADPDGTTVLPIFLHGRGSQSGFDVVALPDIVEFGDVPWHDNPTLPITLVNRGTADCFHVQGFGSAFSGGWCNALPKGGQCVASASLYDTSPGYYADVVDYYLECPALSETMFHVCVEAIVNVVR